MKSANEKGPRIDPSGLWRGYASSLEARATGRPQKSPSHRQPELKISKNPTWAHLASAGDMLVIRELNALVAYRWK